MTTKHVSDAQRDTFAACGLIVIDPEGHIATGAIEQQDEWSKEAVTGTYTSSTLRAPEDWRVLTEPCDRCLGAGRIWHDSRCESVDPCPNPNCVGGRRVVTLTATCPTCNGHPVWLNTRRRWQRCGTCLTGVVTLGRFTIAALLPVMGDHRGMDWPGPFVEVIGDGAWMWLSTDSGDCHELNLDPLPRPGQFIARPELVPDSAGREMRDKVQ